MKVYIMIGLVGSGKSSWARMTAGTDFNTIRISNDDIRNMIKDRYTFDLQLEPMVRNMGDALLEQVLSAGKNAIVDDCHLTAEHRQQLCAWIQKIDPDAEIIYVWVKCPNLNALQRRLTDLRGRTKFEWTQVIEKMADAFEEPGFGECDDGVITAIVEVHNGLKTVD